MVFIKTTAVKKNGKLVKGELRKVTQYIAEEPADIILHQMRKGNPFT